MDYKYTNKHDKLMQDTTKKQSKNINNLLQIELIKKSKNEENNKKNKICHDKRYEENDLSSFMRSAYGIIVDENNGHIDEINCECINCYKTKRTTSINISSIEDSLELINKN